MMLIGGNSPTSGYTQRGREAAAVFGPGLMLWLSSAGPQDALQHPGCVHLVRLDNWTVDITPAQYVANVTPQVTRWQGQVAPLIFVLGNEPDIEAGHNGEQVARYAAAMKTAFPGVLVANPPLSVEKSNLVNADGCDVVLMHSYFERQHPDSVIDPMFGRSYQYGLSESAGRPVYVTEFNVVQQNCPIDWPDRNKQAAAWLDQAEADGVAGVCFFILDGEGEWSSFDVGPEAATDILAGRVVRPSPAPQPPPAPNPAPAPPTPRTEAYTRDYDPRGYRRLDNRWEPFIAQHNPEEGDLICAYYDQACEVIGYDANCAIAQGCVETAVFTSSRWRYAHNAAGIGIYADETPDVDFGTVGDGVRAQAELLSDYYGNGMEPWGVLKRYGFGGMRLNKAALRDMDGVWAADTGYSAAIVGYLIDVLGNVLPAPNVSVVTYQIVTPVDCDVAQGSDGGYSHGGNVPGFYAIDYGCARGTPCRAAANGTVGTVYLSDYNPISARTGPSVWIDHDNGFSTFSCHLSRIDVGTGDTVKQGQVIGLTGDPAIDGGYGSGAHLHWEIWDTAAHRRVKMEDLEAAGIAGPWSDVPQIPEVDVHTDGKFDTGRKYRLWNGPKTKAQIKSMGALDLNRGIDARWDTELLAGHPLGFAISGEEAMPSGGVIRYFSNGFVCYYPDGTTTVN